MAAFQRVESWQLAKLADLIDLDADSDLIAEATAAIREVDSGIPAPGAAQSAARRAAAVSWIHDAEAFRWLAVEVEREDAAGMRLASDPTSDSDCQELDKLADTLEQLIYAHSHCVGSVDGLRQEASRLAYRILGSTAAAQSRGHAAAIVAAIQLGLDGSPSAADRLFAPFQAPLQLARPSAVDVNKAIYQASLDVGRTWKEIGEPHDLAGEAAKQRAKRYAKAHSLKLPPRRKPGRPRKANNKPNS